MRGKLARPSPRSPLTSQFRCNGSDGYLAWLDDTLGLRPTANDKLDDTEFAFRVFSSPEQLRREIMERNKLRNKARMVAGYCWDWRSKSDPTKQDVVIPEHHFAMRWNLTKDGGLWMVAPESASEVGCVHTCQGLEVDYIGVIVGPDLVFRDNRVVAQPAMRSKHDKSLNGYKRLVKIDPEEAARRAELIIKEYLPHPDDPWNEGVLCVFHGWGSRALRPQSPQPPEYSI